MTMWALITRSAVAVFLVRQTVCLEREGIAAHIAVISDLPMLCVNVQFENGLRHKRLVTFRTVMSDAIVNFLLVLD